MKREKHPYSPGCLTDVLLDGAKPFTYRSGIRLLLGLPKSSAASMAFRRNISLAGLRYTSPHWNEEFGSSDDSAWQNSSASRPGLRRSSLTGDPDLRREPGETLLREEPHILSRALLLKPGQKFEKDSGGSFPEREMEWSPVLPRTGADEQKSNAVVKGLGNPEEPDRSLIDIPGITRSKPHFMSPNRGDTEPGVETPSTGEMAPSKEPTPEGDSPKFIPRNIWEAGGTIKEQNFTSSPSVLPGVKRRESTNLPFPANSDIASVEPARTVVSSAIPHREKRSRGELMYRSTGAKPETLERLNRAVVELQDQNSQLESQLRRQQSPNRWNAGQPANNVIFIRQPARRPAPRAFWERSYLGRYHLKILR